MGRITIEQVAAQAGVSVTTVSHVFSGKRPVKPATRAHVEKVARALGYTPNAIAASLRVQRTNTAMVMIPDITNPFYPAFARGVQDVLRRADYHVLLCNTDGDEREERIYLDDAMSGRVDGVITTMFRVGVEALVPLARSGLAVVNLGYGTPDADVDAVRTDDRLAAHQAVGYLLRTAPGRVALINGDVESPVAQARQAGYIEAYAAAGIPVPDDYVVPTEFTRQGGQEGLRKLLALPEPPRAVFCSNDLIAIGAIDAAQAHGVRVPQDMAIMGCDDIDAAELVTPRLTTVRIRAEQLGRACGELLVDRMTGEYDGAPREVVVPHDLVVRDSA